MKRLLSLLVLVVMILAIQMPAVAQDEQDWVIFIYLCGTDLESEDHDATDNMMQMLDAGTNGNVRFVIQTGGTAEWSEEIGISIPSDRLARWEICNGTIQPLWEGELRSMGASDTLGAFVQWGLENYNAKRYGLVLWDHGSGSINGVCFDELYDNDSLLLKDIASALEGYENCFEFIGFDACLMATLEVAQTISPYAKYMIASQEVEPGSGWNFQALGSFLLDNPEADGLQLGCAIADSYLASNNENGDGEMSTLSVTDLGMIPALAEAMSTAGWKMLESTSDSAILKSITQGIKRAENYGGNTPKEGYTNMVDIGSMMREIQSAVPEAGQVLTALNNAVLYRVAGPGREQATGLSVYYPLEVQGTTEYEVFNEGSPSEGYRHFVASMLYGSQTGDAADFMEQLQENGSDESWLSNILANLPQGSEIQGFSSDSQSNLTIQSAYLNDEGTYTLQLDPADMNNLLTATFTLLMRGDDDTLYSLGRDDELYIDFENGTIQDAFNGYWVALPDGQLLSLYLVEATDHANLYSSPVMLNRHETNMRILYDWDKEEFCVLGCWDGISESGSASKELIKIQPGDAIVPMYDVFDATSGEHLFTTEGESYMAEADIVINFFQLPAAEYYYSFSLTDLFGLVVNTDFTVFEVNEQGDVLFTEQPATLWQ